MMVSRFLILLFSLWSMTSLAQDAQDQYERQSLEKRELDRKEWSKIKDRIGYGKARKEESSGDGSFNLESGSGGEASGNSHQKKQDRSDVQQPKKSPSNEGVSNLVVFIAIMVLAALIGFLIYKFAMNSNVAQNAKVLKDEEEDDRSPHDIPKTELELSLEKALEEDNYREAVRIYFIFIIKELSEKGLIRWEKEKTNMAYQNELLERPEHKLFSKVTYFFEYVWYGEHDIDRKQYKELEPSFKELLNKLEGSAK